MGERTGKEEKKTRKRKKRERERERERVAGPLSFSFSFFPCAQDWIRTSTPFPAPPPQGGASTNFATWAFPQLSCRNDKPGL